MWRGDYRWLTWTVRQTGHGVRSWRIDVSKAHAMRHGEQRTLCGRVPGRETHGPIFGSTVTTNDVKCKPCAKAVGEP